MYHHLLFNPTKQEKIMVALMEASSGKNSVKKVVKEKINMDTGNVASYPALMNVTYQLVQFQQANALSATLCEIHIKKVREN